MQSTMIASAEIVALAGFDFAWLDMEHTAMTFRDVEISSSPWKLRLCAAGPRCRERTELHRPSPRSRSPGSERPARR